MMLPDIFKEILWSYDFNKCDPVAMKKTVIVQALTYGKFKHWKWIRSFYGDDTIRKVLSGVRGTEIGEKSKELIGVIFNFNNWNYAPRGS